MVPDEGNKKLLSPTEPASKKRHMPCKDPRRSCSKKYKRDKKLYMNVATQKVPRGKEADMRAHSNRFHPSIHHRLRERSKAQPSKNRLEVPRTNGIKKDPHKISLECLEEDRTEDTLDNPHESEPVNFKLEADQSPELNTSFIRNNPSFRGLSRKPEDSVKRDKVWDYVCKRSVLVAPTTIQFSLKNARGLEGSQKATGNGRSVRTSIPVFGKMILVTLTCEATVAEEWLKQQGGQLFGLDVEWEPNRGKGVQNKVALLQLSGDNECLLLQMLFMDSIPQSLVDFLLDTKRKKAGVGIREDAKKLFRDYGLVCNGMVELTLLAAQHLGRSECKHMGLKSLAKEVIGITMQKLKRVTLSNWANPILNRSQIVYACVDAWASFAVCRKLQVADT